MPRWIAGHRLLHGDRYLEPGEPMPAGVEDWPTFASLRAMNGILDAEVLEGPDPTLLRYRAFLQTRHRDRVYETGELLPETFGQEAAGALVELVRTHQVTEDRDLPPVEVDAAPDATGSDGSGPPPEPVAPTDDEVDEVDADFATDVPLLDENAGAAVPTATDPAKFVEDVPPLAEQVAALESKPVARKKGG